MKDEEMDWALYHMIPDGRPVTITLLAERSGFTREEVAASLERMENNCLVCVMGETVTLLSLSEMLMINEILHAPDMPVTIENGIIKAKKGDQ